MRFIEKRNYNGKHLFKILFLIDIKNIRSSLLQALRKNNRKKENIKIRIKRRII
jgi:ribosomal protein L10